MPPSAGFGSRATTTWSLARSDCGERFENWVHEASGQDEERTNELRTALAERWYAHVRLPPVLLDEEGRRAWVEEMDFGSTPGLRTRASTDAALLRRGGLMGPPSSRVSKRGVAHAAITRRSWLSPGRSTNCLSPRKPLSRIPADPRRLACSSARMTRVSSHVGDVQDLFLHRLYGRGAFIEHGRVPLP